MENKMKQQFTKNLKWFLLWMLLPPFWAIKIRKTGMKKRWIIPLMLLSPVCMCLWVPLLFLLLFLLAVYIDAERFSNVKTLETREDICELTEMTDFPEFTYEGRSENAWDMRIMSYFTFTESLTDTQLNRFHAKCKELDNPRWEQTDSATWTCVSNNVEMTIRKDGFTIEESIIGGSPQIDSIPNLTLPPYQIVSQTHWLCGPDYADDIVILLDKVPTSTFFKDWTYDPQSKKYTFEVSDKYNDLWTLTARKGSKVIRISCTDF